MTEGWAVSVLRTLLTQLIHPIALGSNANRITERAELAAAAATAGEALLSAARRRLLYTYSSSGEKVSKRDVIVVAAVGAH
eukprot:CAMPEP_0179452674 /NCGR_PEP_ID=MMETSP0799-20121207/36544_2 /TAXON_ID=46947 /ORGANISM="Geminigera cryophila, Strain CCMP2564" /LENGTH=80 /DNA_ID=CAMNT_0021248801 /DNA_START=121 /DNA_END=363 /DNA_ORIENTATION=-